MSRRGAARSTRSTPANAPANARDPQAGPPERRHAGRARTSSSARSASRSGSRVRPGRGTWLAVAGAVAAVVAAGVLVAITLGGPKTGAEGTAVQGRGGQWTDISAERLALKLGHKDFTLLNVKTPYVGEIARTDLYIPYDQLAPRAAELPADHSAQIVVYCRTGHESAIAAETLLDLGYTNIANLDGGMTAWAASGRQLVTIDRGGG